MVVFYVVISIIACVILWWIGTSNLLKKTIVKIEEADSGIDVALTKRYDVLSKLLDITKAYAKHEKETLFSVIELRQGMSPKEKSSVNTKMDDMYKQLTIVAEAYPELKSSENFKQLQIAVMDVEEHLQASRRFYNSNVSILNQYVVSFPASIVANKNQIKQREFFEQDEMKRQDVEMKF